MAHYPNTHNSVLSERLGITESALRTIASRNGIKKSPEYMSMMHSQLMQAKRNKLDNNRPNYTPTIIEQNIIIGSLIGDGSLALYGRSKNAHYREHGSIQQIQYRQWKVKQLCNLDFKIDKNGKISSPSHPLYTKLYHLFYPNNRKTLTEENIKLLDHPIGLACLYLDDGSLVIDRYRSKSAVHIFPRIYLYTLSYTEQENLLLIEHIKKIFSINFKIKRHPDGTGFMLELNKRNEINNFIDIVKPIIEEIPTMMYKVDIRNRLNEYYREYSGNSAIIIDPLVVTNNNYSKEDEYLITTLLAQGKSYKEIAHYLKRSYWGITDKVRRMRGKK